MIKKYIFLIILVLFAGNLNAEAKTYKMVFVPASEKGDESDYTSLIAITEKLTGFNIDTIKVTDYNACLLYTSPSPRDRTRSRMPSSA